MTTEIRVTYIEIVLSDKDHNKIEQYGRERVTRVDDGRVAYILPGGRRVGDGWSHAVVYEDDLNALGI